MKLFGQVDQIQNILLEARSSKANASLQKFATNARILATGKRNFADISSGCFANSRQRVYRRYALRKQRIGSLQKQSLASGVYMPVVEISFHIDLQASTVRMTTSSW